jgi:hypothetical protein
MIIVILDQVLVEVCRHFFETLTDIFLHFELGTLPFSQRIFTLFNRKALFLRKINRCLQCTVCRGFTYFCLQSTSCMRCLGAGGTHAAVRGLRVHQPDKHLGKGGRLHSHAPPHTNSLETFRWLWSLYKTNSGQIAMFQSFLYFRISI